MSVFHDVFAAIARLSLRDEHIRIDIRLLSFSGGGPTQNVDLVNGILICRHSDNRYGKIDSVWQILWNRILAVIGLSEYLDRLNLLMFWRPESIATMPAGVRADKHVLETATSEQISDVG